MINNLNNKKINRQFTVLGIVTLISLCVGVLLGVLTTWTIYKFF